MTSQTELEELDAIRKKAGLGIDPKTAEIDWQYGDVVRVTAYILPVLRAATVSGSNSAPCPRQPKTRYGNG